MSAWALQLRPDDLEPLAVLWRIPGVEALRQTDCVWLRGSEPDDATRRLLPTIANDGRFEILKGGALLKPGHHVPSGIAPTGPWQPLRKFLSIILPPANLPARTLPTVEIELVPSSIASEPNSLLTDLAVWHEYARQAPQIRLKHCQFAVCRDGRTLISGTPLPPLPGTRGVARAGLVVPSGWTWSPGVEAEILAQAWGIPKGAMWLLWPGQPVERVQAEQLVAANHSAVQLTWKAFQHGRTL
ncbi:MAG: hypothetical protein JWM11_2555 [Planctomycetaceae bacterium]|nr:hypothetical protein [Planctomycetaceae bacterium]